MAHGSRFHRIRIVRCLSVSAILFSVPSTFRSDDTSSTSPFLVAAAASRPFALRPNQPNQPNQLRGAEVDVDVDAVVYCSCRGGATARANQSTTTGIDGAPQPPTPATTASPTSTESEEDAYSLLAKSVRRNFPPEIDGIATPKVSQSKLVSAFKSLSSAQKAFKGLDGVAHEAYQRTHTTDEVDLSVAGRAKRTAARTSAVADGLGACELCELMEHPERFDFSDNSLINGTLAGRQVLLNLTNAAPLGEGNAVSVLVLYEPLYHGGAGERHGGIEDLEEDEKLQFGVHGRLLVVLADSLVRDLDQTMRLLLSKPHRLFRTSDRNGSNNKAIFVQPTLFSAAVSVVSILKPLLETHNASAIHIVGRSLSGGIASLAAVLLNGELSLPRSFDERRGDQPKNPLASGATQNNATIDKLDKLKASSTPLEGLGRGRTSAVSLGAPPCISDNIEVKYVTSILFGDDVICRLSPDSLDRFFSRTRRALSRRSVIGKRLNWMSDALSLATSNLQSKGGEAKLVAAGQAFLVRPRRLGGMCSMHEIGTQVKSGREAFRATVLWQLNDVLLSRSMWKHHQLESYIQGIDRVHLRGIDETELEDDGSESTTTAAKTAEATRWRIENEDYTND